MYTNGRFALQKKPRLVQAIDIYFYDSGMYKEFDSRHFMKGMQVLWVKCKQRPRSL